MITTAGKAGLPVSYLAGLPSAVWLFTGSASIVLGVWPDIGSLMLGAFVIPAALYFHRFWTFDDPAQRQTQTLAFYRNVEILGASLVMFGLFGWVRDGLRFALTGPLTRWYAARRGRGGDACPTREPRASRAPSRAPTGAQSRR